MNIHEKRTVRQFGDLPELYRDARSTKHKITCLSPSTLDHTAVTTIRCLQSIPNHLKMQNN
jgi:hypothetical protein